MVINFIANGYIRAGPCLKPEDAQAHQLDPNWPLNFDAVDSNLSPAQYLQASETIRTSNCLSAYLLLLNCAIGCPGVHVLMTSRVP